MGRIPANSPFFPIKLSTVFKGTSRLQLCKIGFDGLIARLYRLYFGKTSLCCWLLTADILS